MKNRLKSMFVAAIALSSLTGCTLWEDERQEVIPLPGTEIPITPEPWEPGGEDEEPVWE